MTREPPPLIGLTTYGRNADGRFTLPVEYAIILIAFASQIIEVGWGSVGVSLALMSVGAVLYFPIRKIYKPGVPDVDPFEQSPEED